MSRLRALSAAALVAAVVFYALAAPLLREWFGPAAVVPAYVAVALLAGVATYRAVLVLSRLAAETGDEDLDGEVDADDLAEVVADDVEADEDDLAAVLEEENGVLDGGTGEGAGAAGDEGSVEERSTTGEQSGAERDG